MSVSKSAVTRKTKCLPKGIHVVKGYDFNEGIDYDKLLNSYENTGIQATSFSTCVDIINKMINLKDQPISVDNEYIKLNPLKREKSNCTIFLGYTSNMISCGVRDIIRYLAQHNLVDVIVTTAGGIEEDFIKCLKPSYIGDFHKYKDAELRDNGINRIGNMLVPNDNYVLFDKWLTPLLGQMCTEHREKGTNWTPSKMIEFLGKSINNEESVYYWCYKNKIPVFCPALIDGSIGDMLYFHALNHCGELRVDIVEDVVRLNKQAELANNTGMIILGGGVIKHQIANANLMRNGANYTVYINTGNEYEASDSGAPIAEAISWGKIRKDAEVVKLFAEISLVFPLIVAQTFAKYVERKKKKAQS